MTQIPGTIELSFEHANASGDFVETLISVDFTYTPGYRATWNDPAEGPEWEYVRASRIVDGKWKTIPAGDFLDEWSAAKLAQCDPAEIADCIPSGPDPDDLRDAAMDRAMDRGSW
jgi:hypothetical protein